MFTRDKLLVEDPFDVYFEWVWTTGTSQSYGHVTVKYFFLFYLVQISHEEETEYK